jgi:hypothetical protein
MTAGRSFCVIRPGMETPADEQPLLMLLVRAGS